MFTTFVDDMVIFLWEFEPQGRFMAGQNKNKNISNEKSKSAKFLLFHFDKNIRRAGDQEQ